jgi:hypothetical protein
MEVLMESQLMELPDIVQWARKVAKHLDRGFLIQDVSELGAAPQYARIEVQEAGGDASRPYTFSVNRLKGSQSVQLEIERELRKRLCPVCDARAESAPLGDSDGFQIDCSVCGSFTIAGSLAVLFRSARTNGNVGLINKLGYLAGYIQATKTPVRVSPENWLTAVDEYKRQGI